ncbi:hypothetical protein NC651_019384 [Populus alba x Populus x berolinensis]|nr:hypothetical protein NC651_019384 [Populus alba x Populus x berolinensis]
MQVNTEETWEVDERIWELYQYYFIPFCYNRMVYIYREPNNQLVLLPIST